MKLFRFEAEEVFARFEVPCGECGWKTRWLYVIAEREGEALELAKKGVFLCGECMSKLIYEKQYEISRVEG